MSDGVFGESEPYSIWAELCILLVSRTYVERAKVHEPVSA